eukprot:COSAG01_NODE_3924_length_5529_cov_1.581584_5_plen_133_part_00
MIRRSNDETEWKRRGISATVSVLLIVSTLRGRAGSRVLLPPLAQGRERPRAVDAAALGAGVSLLPAVLTEIYLCSVCSCPELLRMELLRRPGPRPRWRATRTTSAPGTAAVASSRLAAVLTGIYLCKRLCFA